MRYPKELHDATTIDIETGEVRMRRAHPMLNNFNEWLLMACRWRFDITSNGIEVHLYCCRCRCNMDIKFIWLGGDTKALVYYITDYIIKTNLSFHDTHVLIHRAIDSFTKQAHNQEYIDAVDRSRRLILRCFNTLASQQEISSVQVASYLMGWPDHYCSHTFVKGTLPPSFLTFPELENGKSDWVEIFTRDRARKISGHVFERFFFLWTLDPFFLAKTFFIGTRVLVSRTGPIELKFSPQVTIILPQNPFFLFKKISSPSVFLAEIRESFLETYISITKNPINFEGEVKIENKKKGFWGRVMVTSGKNFSSIGPN